MLLIGIALCNSCAVGPNYSKPTVRVPKHFKEGQLHAKPAAKHWKVAEPRDDINRGQWWLVFADDTLTDLEKKLITHNQNLVTAAANFQNARAIVDQARASYYPNVAAALNIIRQTIGNGTTTIATSSIQSTTVGTATTGIIAPKRFITTAYVDFLNANWEPDIWGQVRRSVESKVANAQSLAALWASTRLSMEASLAQLYFQIRALDNDQKWLDKIVTANQANVLLLTHQYQSGVASRADIVQAQSQLENAQAQAVHNHILRSQTEHAIATLIGIPASSFALPTHRVALQVPNIPSSVPSQWLERRPDVAQAERLMQAASAQIGQAISTYFPTLNLSGTGNGSSTNLGDLIRSPIGGWSLGLVAIDTIFDGGLRSATVKAARTAYTAQVATYRQTVLSAFQDVEDQLVAVRVLAQQSIIETALVKSAQQTLAIANNQYHAGTIAYNNVLNAKINAYNAAKSADDIRGQRLTSTVNLVKALGGGWHNCLLRKKHNGVKQIGMSTAHSPPPGKQQNPFAKLIAQVYS